MWCAAFGWSNLARHSIPEGSGSGRIFAAIGHAGLSMGVMQRAERGGDGGQESISDCRAAPLDQL